MKRTQSLLWPELYETTALSASLPPAREQFFGRGIRPLPGGYIRTRSLNLAHTQPRSRRLKSMLNKRRYR